MNSLDILMYGHRLVLAVVDGLPAEEWDHPGVCGDWSIKEIIAHLASYELVLVEVLAGFDGGGPTPYLDAFRVPGGDFGEGVPPSGVAADGTTGTALHNRYPVDYHCAAQRAVGRIGLPAVRNQRSRRWPSTRRPTSRSALTPRGSRPRHGGRPGPCLGTVRGTRSTTSSSTCPMGISASTVPKSPSLATSKGGPCPSVGVR